MMQAKFLQTWAVNQLSVFIQIIQLRVGGGVLARIQRGGDGLGAGDGFAEQRVGERGFAHAALPEQDVGFAAQLVAQNIHVAQCA